MLTSYADECLAEEKRAHAGAVRKGIVASKLKSAADSYEQAEGGRAIVAEGIRISSACCWTEKLLLRNRL